MDLPEGGSFEEETGEPDEGESEPVGGMIGDDRAPWGWVPPEQRTWRHPSEIAWARTLDVRPPVRAASSRRTAWATSLVGAGAVAALVSGGLMLASQSRPAPEASTATTVAKVSTPPTWATRSIVRLEVTGAHSTSYGCGIVVAAGGMVATDASLLAGAQRIVAETSGGRREGATLVAIDAASDVALLQLSDSLPMAKFVDWSELQPGTGAVEMAVETLSPGEPASAWWNETIASAGAPVGSGPAEGMASVVATTPAGVRPSGAVLMEKDGSIVGLLDRSGVPAAGGGAVFLPGQFVLQVARELMADDGQILHGWLGIKGSDSRTGHPKGALVTAVDPVGAADHRLRVGDVIETVDGHRIRSMADLRSRLYMLPPHSWVRLVVERHDRTVDVGLRLSSAA